MGFTTSRAGSHWDGDGKPVPSRKASEAEYRALVAELSALDAGFVQLLAPDFDEETLADIARLSGLGVCINASIYRSTYTGRYVSYACSSSVNGA